MNAKQPGATTHKPSCRLVIAGAAHVDRTGWLEAPSALGCSNPGRFEETPGGTALNVASVIASLGGAPELVSLVAQDSAGSGLRADLKQRGITGHVDGETAANTGTYTCLIEPDGSLLVGMADMAIYNDFLARNAVPLVQALSLEDWLCVDTNLPPHQMRQLLQAGPARRVGLTVSKAKAPRMKEFTDLIDIVFTNRVEACSLCGVDDGDIETIGVDEIAAALRELGIKSAVITDGTKDVTLLDGAEVQLITVPPVQHVADVTGAGDALVGASLHALMCGFPLAKAIEFGVKAAQATIQAKGALRSDLASLIGLANRPTASL
ncbi:MAG: PfkB family carbohydrate kinase [Rhizobiaceae bacterium]